MIGMITHTFSTLASDKPLIATKSRLQVCKTEPMVCRPASWSFLISETLIPADCRS